MGKATVVKSKPGFFIVGAPKCGTTVLDHYLGLHSDVFMARKEMHFFGSDLHFGSQFYRRDEAAYRSEFDAADGHKVIGESSVWYLSSERAAAEIKAFNPEARIIIMVREPVEMLHSLYHQFLFDGNENLPTFERALAAENDRCAGKFVPRLNYFPQGLVYRRAVDFAPQVRRYFEVFGRDRVHVIVYDEIAADAPAVYARVLDFLGLKPFRIERGLQVINGNKFVKHTALRAVLNDPVLRSAVLGIRPWLPRSIFSALQRTEARLQKLNARPIGRQPLDPKLRWRLTEEFAPAVEQLGNLLDRDLSSWSRCQHWHQDVETPELAGSLASVEACPEPVVQAH